ncbi:unnamed protein product [Danaus chrysippus]|uniref:(African queen) hypothetical protein n=1 Tax=Danaus chrysippus TaxID=151541 RepID=A0A8J2VTJ6_9NEOP|nr:unnamed protein product [Danaus chrysippus]
MAECSFARCQQERRAIRRELQRWTKNMVYILVESRIIILVSYSTVKCLVEVFQRRASEKLWIATSGRLMHSPVNVPLLYFAWPLYGITYPLPGTGIRDRDTGLG